VAPSNQWALGTWYAGDDWADARSSPELKDRVFTPGEGDPLALEEVAGAEARAGQTDTDQADNRISILLLVGGSNPSDLEAVGATATGHKDDQVTVQIGARNLGPADIDDHPERRGFTTDVRIPARSTVVAADRNCKGFDDVDFGQPGDKRYYCFAPDRLPVGESALFSFTVRLDADVVGAGTLTVAENGDEARGDVDKSNNKARIVITGVDGDGSDGGALPITGMNTRDVVLTGAVLLLGGIIAVLSTRRWRTGARTR
jgi:hypothetical protein